MFNRNFSSEKDWNFIFFQHFSNFINNSFLKVAGNFIFVVTIIIVVVIFKGVVRTQNFIRLNPWNCGVCDRNWVR